MEHRGGILGRLVSEHGRFDGDVRDAGMCKLGVDQEMFWWECLGYEGQNFLVGPWIFEGYQIILHGFWNVKVQGSGASFQKKSPVSLTGTYFPIPETIPSPFLSPVSSLVLSCLFHTHDCLLHFTRLQLANL